MADMPWRSLRAMCKIGIKRKLNLTVEGLEHLPERGGVLIGARHFHHLYDGAALMATIPRPISIIVGLDWITSAPLKASMMALCRSAGWPVVYRSNPAIPVPAHDARALLRRATRETLEQLKAGKIVVVFPEAYPNIDPGPTPKTDEQMFLPFEPGVVRLAEISHRLGTPAPIVPVGFCYKRGKKWRVTMRFGPAVEPIDGETSDEVLARVEQAVRDLSV